MADRTGTSELTIRVVGPPADQAGLTVVLLHGFGAPGDDLVSLARVIQAPARTRYLFPEGPLELPGIYSESRAWWLLDLARLERVLAGGPEDRSDEVPEGLAEARSTIDALLRELAAGGAGRIVLGGFSQGAMLALDVALHTSVPLAALVVMSATRINGAAWKASIDRLRGMPILMSHGKSDGLLSFAVATSLRDQLRAAGAEVDWIEFPDGHEIPPVVLAGVGRLLARI